MHGLGNGIIPLISLFTSHAFISGNLFKKIYVVVTQTLVPNQL